MCSRFRHNLKNLKFPTAVKQTKEMHKTAYRKCTILCYSGFAPMHRQLPLPSLIRWYQGSLFCMVRLDSIRQSSFQEVWSAHCDDKTRNVEYCRHSRQRHVLYQATDQRNKLLLKSIRDTIFSLLRFLYRFLWLHRYGIQLHLVTKKKETWGTLALKTLIASLI